jgi:hypothetical protein
MSGYEAIYYIGMAMAAAGTVVTTADSIRANKERQKILENELRAGELQALDEENLRLRALRDANEEMMANAGGIDAFASPSLIAARNFNFRMGLEDISNIRYNQASSRSTIAAHISILKSNSKALKQAGIFEIAGTAMMSYAGYQSFKKPKDEIKTQTETGYPLAR